MGRMAADRTNAKRQRRAQVPPGCWPIVLSAPLAAGALGISLTGFYEKLKRHQLPPGRQLGPGRVGWLLREIEAVADELPEVER